MKQLSTPIEPSASDHEPKGEGGGQTCPQKVNNAPTLKGPKSRPITLVLAISSSSYDYKSQNFVQCIFFSCIATFSK